MQFAGGAAGSGDAGDGRRDGEGVEVAADEMSASAPAGVAAFGRFAAIVQLTAAETEPSGADGADKERPIGQRLTVLPEAMRMKQLRFGDAPEGRGDALIALLVIIHINADSSSSVVAVLITDNADFFLNYAKKNLFIGKN